MSSAPERSVVIGVGNAFGGDDAAGLRVVAELRRRTPAGVRLVEHEGEPTALLDAWDGAAAAVVVDAVASGAPPGSVHRFDATTTPLPSRFAGASTHAFSVAQAIELGRALGRLPDRMVVIGIEGASFEAGAGLTAAVARSLGAAADAVLAEVSGTAGEH